MEETRTHTRGLRFLALSETNNGRTNIFGKKNIYICYAGHVARMGEKRHVYRLLIGKPEEKRLLGRPRRR
jgi:hypothetical protein